MSIAIETLFAKALGLQAPWSVKEVELDTTRQLIGFTLSCEAKQLSCPLCLAPGQGIHDWRKHDWRHLNFLKLEAWLYAELPHIAFSACAKTTQTDVPGAREGSGFTALFEVLAMSLCRELPVRQATSLLRCHDKQLWRRIEDHVDEACKSDDMNGVKRIGIEDTSLHKEQSYITVVHDLEAKRLLYVGEGRDHQTVVNFATGLKAYGGDPKQIEPVCQDMSTAYATGADMVRPEVQISYDCFHVIAMSNEAIGEIRRQETSSLPKAIKEALEDYDRRLLNSLTWRMQRNPGYWSAKQTKAMHWLQYYALMSARAVRMKMTLRAVQTHAVQSNDALQAKQEFSAWISRATRCRLVSFNKLAKTLNQELDDVVHRIIDNSSNDYVEAMNSLLQQATRVA